MEFDLNPYEVWQVQQLVDSAEPRPVAPLLPQITEYSLDAAIRRMDAAERAVAEWQAAYSRLATLHRREVRLRMATSYMMGAGWAVAGALLVAWWR
jgi:hypothetical protein